MNNRGITRMAWGAALVLMGLWAVPAAGEDAGGEKIDWNRARRLYRKIQGGGQLTADDRAYLDRARAARQGRRNRGGNGNGGGRRGNRGRGSAPEAKASLGLKPLSELGRGRYKGQVGGLYGAGKNVPPKAHQKLAAKAISLIRPLDANGRPAAQGKVVLLSIGMSNTTQEFSQFKRIADRDSAKSRSLIIVDGAQGGRDASRWTTENAPTWSVLDQRLKSAGVNAKQVQVGWIKQAIAGPGRIGEFPKHSDRLADELAKIVRVMKKRFPNLRVVYLSSRIYAGHATSNLNPEPYAYESAFSVRGVIERQMKGAKDLNPGVRGRAVAPVLLWGPYLWADGTTPRKSDKLVWERKDLGGDGTHPSGSGRTKVANLLLKFFKTDAGARAWFTGSAARSRR